MVAKLNRKIHKGSAALLAVFGFLLVFFFSDTSKDSNEAVIGTAIVHADVPIDNTFGGPGCCGGCGGAGGCAGGCASDCGGCGADGSG